MKSSLVANTVLFVVSAAFSHQQGWQLGVWSYGYNLLLCIWQELIWKNNRPLHSSICDGKSNFIEFRFIYLHLL